MFLSHLAFAIFATSATHTHLALHDSRSVELWSHDLSPTENSNIYMQNICRRPIITGGIEMGEKALYRQLDTLASTRVGQY